MRIVVLSVPDCPNRDVADARLKLALREAGLSKVTVEHRQISTSEQAEAEHFHGSPSIEIDGRDPFAGPETPVGLTCRLYATQGGPAGAPTVEQLLRVLRGHSPD